MGDSSVAGSSAGGARTPEAAEVQRASRAFDRVYATGEWGEGSGFGSRPVNSLEYASFVQRFILLNNIRTVVDLGCGDWQFSQFIDWRGVHYLGLDVAEAVVQANRRKFHTDTVNFGIFAGLDSLPEADLLLCKDVLQHLPNDTVRRYLAAFKRQFRYALVTNDDYPYHLVNKDIAIGDWRTLRLDQEPFLERAPIVLSWVVLTDGAALTVRKLTYLFYREAI